jgi:hypothetical protein
MRAALAAAFLLFAVGQLTVVVGVGLVSKLCVKSCRVTIAEQGGSLGDLFRGVGLREAVLGEGLLFSGDGRQDQLLFGVECATESAASEGKEKGCHFGGLRAVGFAG